MLTHDEDKFLQYWEQNRDRENKLSRQIRAGLPLGISFAIAILLCLFTGWYQKAMMEATTEMNPWLLIFAVLLIAVLFGIIYKKHQWEQNEQSYLEILSRKKKLEQELSEDSN